MFACFLAQVPDSIAIVDLWSLAPALISEFPVIIKATINCEITFDDHCRRFKPDIRILFLRDPRDTFQSLNAKHYKDIRGTILEKLRVLDQVFSRRAELFDVVLNYEDLIRDPARVASVLREKGLDVPDAAPQFPRGPRQIAQFAIDNSEWCRHHYLKDFGFGNLHWMDWGTLKDISFPSPSEAVLAGIREACPLVDAYYVPIRSVRGDVLAGTTSKVS
jgi:hypothetical protein